MKNLYKDHRFQKVLAANILSSIGSGITMIGVPWLLINQVNGGVVFGYITIVMTAINFLLSPAIGHLVDRVSRKGLLMFGEGFGFLIVASFAGYGVLGLDYEVWHYILLYGSGSFYYNIFYPAIFAFNQEIFDKSVYKHLNGAMEIQGQLSSVIAGALAAWLISTIELQWLLLVDAFTYLGAFLIISSIPYIKKSREAQSVSFFYKVTEGYRFLKQRPVLFLFLMASFMPFIGVMVTNYLFPVYLAEVLKTDGSIYGLHSMIYGIGAVAAGIFIPILARKWGNERSIILTVSAYSFAISIVAVFQNVVTFLFLVVILAFGNAGTRVARNSFMMENVPNAIIGRVDSLFRALGLGKRIFILSLFTQFTAEQSITNSFYLLTVLMVTAFVVIIVTARALSLKQKVTNALQE